MTVREFRHLFRTTRRIVATIRIDLDRARVSPGDMGCVRCEWEGSRERQPSAELYEEYRQWVDGVWRWLADELGTPYLGLLETPDGMVELWLYDPGGEPRFVKILPTPTGKPLSNALFGLPIWNDER
jgi:hypothetical protein